MVNKRMLVDIIEDIFREGDFIFENNNPQMCASWRDDKLLLEVKRRVDDLPVFMKIIPDDEGDKEVDAAYKVHKLIQDKRYVEPILENEPRLYLYTNDYGERMTCKAIVIERAKMTLKDHFRALNKLSIEKRENDLFDIILQASMGLEKLHNKGIRHKDVKESNIMLYPLGWGIGDYGICNISDAVRNNRSTKTITGDLEYLSYELIESSIHPKSWHTVNCSTDIFALGVVLYKGLDPKHLGPFSKFRNNTSKNSKAEYNAKWVLDDIEKSGLPEKSKHFLKRMLGEAPPEGIFGPERKKFRYMSVDELLDDAKNWPNIKKDGGISPQYAAFIKDKDNFLKLLYMERRKVDISGLVKDESIDKIVTAYENLQEQFNTSGVKQSARVQDSFLREVVDQYNMLRNKQEAVLKKLIDNIKTQDDFIAASEKVYLWGPPFTNKNRGASDGKARYTYYETSHHKTHYHKKPGLKER
jgi:serine/threonine protein kinase